MTHLTLAPQWWNRSHPSVVVLETPEACGALAGELIINRLARRANARIMLPTGRTPLPMYAYLRAASACTSITEQAALFQIDEYCDLAPGHPLSYRVYLERELDGVRFCHYHYLNPHSEVAEETLRYQKLLDTAPMDVVVLGLGRDGHVAFNGPGADLVSSTRQVALGQETRQDAASAFAPLDPPTHALTVGMDTLASAREIILLVTGVHKQAALERLLDGESHAQFPASLLKSHPRLTIIADAAASAGMVSNGVAPPHAVVVLGHREPGDDPEHRISAESYERLRLAERIARQGPVTAVILTGSSTNQAGYAEAEQMREAWSVPHTPTILEVAGRNTAENATRSLPLILAMQGIQQVTVITSAWHLRARWFFTPYRRYGLRVSHRRVWRIHQFRTMLFNELRLFASLGNARALAWREVKKRISIRSR